MQRSKGIIGNSSSGIIEASIYKIPVINIGNRQNGRPQSNNIVNCKTDYKSILNKIKYIKKNKNFLKSLKKTKNTYFLKNSSDKITNILMKIKKNSDLLKKF